VLAVALLYADCHGDGVSAGWPRGVFPSGDSCPFPSEVIAGLLLGACGSALFLLLQRNHRVSSMRSSPGAGCSV
jgi:hypothetical protein